MCAYPNNIPASKKHAEAVSQAHLCFCQMLVTYSGEMSIVVREWLPVPRWAEVRGFMCRRQLTALSQYHQHANPHTTTTLLQCTHAATLPHSAMRTLATPHIATHRHNTPPHHHTWSHRHRHTATRTLGHAHSPHAQATPPQRHTPPRAHPPYRHTPHRHIATTAHLENRHYPNNDV